MRSGYGLTSSRSDQRLAHAEQVVGDAVMMATRHAALAAVTGFGMAR
jgi:hypothetical protein